MMVYQIRKCRQYMTMGFSFGLPAEAIVEKPLFDQTTGMTIDLSMYRF
jgi:hypothetical protein